jgi:hypothetical protein
LPLFNMTQAKQQRRRPNHQPKWPFCPALQESDPKPRNSTSSTNGEKAVRNNSGTSLICGVKLRVSAKPSHIGDETIGANAIRQCFLAHRTRELRTALGTQQGAKVAHVHRWREPKSQG